MSLYKRKDSPYWWVKISSLEGGAPLQRSTGTSDKRKAYEYHDKLKASAWDVANMNTTPNHTWDEAGARWLREMEHKATISEDARKIEWLAPHLSTMLLKDIKQR